MTLAAGIIALLLLLWFLQGRMIYFPYPHVPDPRALGLASVEDARFSSADGVALHGWFAPAAGAPRDLALLVCHGNAGNVSHRGHLLEGLSAAGLHVLVFDYRGYGLSERRSPGEAALLRDARAALDWLCTRTGLPAERVVLFGESLGAAVALQLAEELLPRSPHALVLEAPFSSLTDVAAHHYRWLPVRLLLRDRYDNLGRIADLHAPLLVVHGARDTIVPVEYGRRVFEHAHEPKRLRIVEGVGHNDLWRDDTARLQDLLAFLDELAAPAAAAGATAEQ